MSFPKKMLSAFMKRNRHVKLEHSLVILPVYDKKFYICFDDGRYFRSWEIKTQMPGQAKCGQMNQWQDNWMTIIHSKAGALRIIRCAPD